MVKVVWCSPMQNDRCAQEGAHNHRVASVIMLGDT